MFGSYLLHLRVALIPYDQRDIVSGYFAQVFGYGLGQLIKIHMQSCVNVGNIRIFFVHPTGVPVHGVVCCNIIFFF